MNTNFQGKKMPKEKVPTKSLSVIMLDSVVKAKKNYYPQTLGECKYEPKKINMENLIEDDLSYFDHSDSKLIMILMMKRTLTMKKIMTNPMNN